MNVTRETKMIKYDIAVVGGGPAGYMAAIKAARLGAKTVLFEKSVVGGTCLNRGCIPTKTYLKTAEIIAHIHSAKQRGIMLAASDITMNMSVAVNEKNKVVKQLTSGIAALLKNNGVDVYHGEAKINADKTVSVGSDVFAVEKVILAGGSRAAKLNLPGMDSKRVLTSDEILDIDHVPGDLVIVGGGVIGVEMACVFAAFGSRVTILELADRLLPMLDSDVSLTIRKSLEKKDIIIHAGVKLEKVEELKNKITVFTDKQHLMADYVLLSVGREPDLSAVSGIEIETERGRIKTDDAMRTSVDWIYAPGDINGRSMLAHAAFAMGDVAAENAMGNYKTADLKYVPSCVYTTPEVGCVGLGEQQAKETHDISIGLYPFRSNGRALASGEAEGFVKVITDKRFGEVLGVHIVGPGAAEMINEAASLMNAEVTANEIAGYIHAHPTYSEAFMEAAADSIHQCLHLPVKK